MFASTGDAVRLSGGPRYRMASALAPDIMALAISSWDGGLPGPNHCTPAGATGTAFSLLSFWSRDDGLPGLRLSRTTPLGGPAAPRSFLDLFEPGPKKTTSAA